MVKGVFGGGGLEHSCSTFVLFLHALSFMRGRCASKAAAERPAQNRASSVPVARGVEFATSPKRRKREQETVIRYKESAWWRMTRGVNVKDDDSLEGQQFRSCFRIPFVLF